MSKKSVLRSNLVTKVWKYVNRKKRIASLPPGLKPIYDPSELDEDARILIMARLVKDPIKAQKLMAKYQAKTALDVIEAMPPRKGKTRWQKFISWIQRIEGSYPYDPVAARIRRDLKNPPKPTLRFNYVETDHES